MRFATGNEPDDRAKEIEESTTNGGPIPGGPIPLREALERLVRSPMPPSNGEGEDSDCPTEE